jgi:hypothetical protein
MERTGNTNDTRRSRADGAFVPRSAEAACAGDRAVAAGAATKRECGRRAPTAAPAGARSADRAGRTTNWSRTSASPRPAARRRGGSRGSGNRDDAGLRHSGRRALRRAGNDRRGARHRSSSSSIRDRPVRPARSSPRADLSPCARTGRCAATSLRGARGPAAGGRESGRGSARAGSSDEAGEYRQAPPERSRITIHASLRGACAGLRFPRSQIPDVEPRHEGQGVRHRAPGPPERADPPSPRSSTRTVVCEGMISPSSTPSR